MGENNTNRIFYLDIVRIIACIMIIMMHTPFGDVDHSPYIISSISYTTAPAIAMFFMVSGALLLRRTHSTRGFLKKRFSKITIPVVVFTLVDVFLAIFKGKISAAFLPRIILSMPITAQGWYGTMWFMYTIAGLYLLTPILSRWIQNATKKELEFYLFLWLITLLFPLLGKWISVDGSVNGMLFHFQGAIGYFVLGYYLNQHVDTTKIHFAWLLVFFLLILALPIALKLLSIEVDFYKHFWYYTFPCAIQASLWFIIIKKLTINVQYCNNQHRFVRLTSNYAFGIYLIHIFIIRDIIRNIPLMHQMGSILQILITTITTFGISWVICWVLSNEKIGKRIIGV